MIRIPSVILLFICLLAGCASYGPLGTPEFEPTLRQDVPAIEGELLYQGPATIIYGVDGYILSDNSRVMRGIILLTDKKLYFIRWLNEKYNFIWDMDYNNITSVELRALGKGRRIVIKSDRNDADVTSFDIATDSGATIDALRSITVCQLIGRHSGNDCQLPE